MSKKEEKAGIPGLIGEGFAHLQHGLDRLTEWGFESMKKSAAEPPRKESKNLFLRELKRFGKISMKTLGKMGTSYYKTYEELKKNG